MKVWFFPFFKIYIIYIYMLIPVSLVTMFKRLDCIAMDREVMRLLFIGGPHIPKARQNIINIS